MRKKPKLLMIYCKNCNKLTPHTVIAGITTCDFCKQKGTHIET